MKLKPKLKLEADKEEEQRLGEGVARLRLLRFVRSQVCAQSAMRVVSPSGLPLG